MDEIKTLDGEFEQKRNRAQADGKHFRFVAKMENGDVSVGLEEVGPGHPFYSLEGSDATYLYCFCLTDIYGEIQLSDFINFEL